MIKVKDKILNHLLRDGRKKTSEKILLQGFKELQRLSKKRSTKLIELAIICSMPIFKIHKHEKNKRKKKDIREVPTLVESKKARVSLAIKLILKGLKSKKLNCSYVKFHNEIFSAAKGEGFAVQVKNEVHKQGLSKKFSFYYQKE